MLKFIRYFIIVFLVSPAIGGWSEATPYDDFQAYMEESQGYVRAIKPGFDRWAEHESLTERAAALKRDLTLGAWAEGFITSYSLSSLAAPETDPTPYGATIRSLYTQVITIFDGYGTLMALLGQDHMAAETYFSTKNATTPTQKNIEEAFQNMMRDHSTYQTMLHTLLETRVAET